MGRWLHAIIERSKLLEYALNCLNTAPQKKSAISQWLTKCIETCYFSWFCWTYWTLKILIGRFLICYTGWKTFSTFGHVESAGPYSAELIGGRLLPSSFFGRLPAVPHSAGCSPFNKDPVGVPGLLDCDASGLFSKR